MKRVTRAAAALLEGAGRLLSRAWDRRPGGLVVLGYHRIDEGGGGLAVRPEDFRAHLEWIEAQGLAVVDVSALRFAPRGQPPHVAITFDDGYRSVAEVAWPELAARGWPATLYVVPDYVKHPRAFPWDTGVLDGRARLVDRALTRELAEGGMSIGSHSLTHLYLPALSEDGARREIAESRHALQDLIGREVTSFAYPMGGWNAGLRRLVAEAGYRSAVTCMRGRNPPGADLLALRRPIAESDPIDFIRIVRGYYDFLRPLDWWRERRRQRRSAPGTR
ncbi:MAG: polysaccharide deacetylase family protein [Actinomycetota bacterium]